MHRFTILIALLVILPGLWQRATAQRAGGEALYAPLILIAPEPTPTPTPRPTSTPVPTSTPPPATTEAQVIQLVNVARAQAGCQPLVAEPHLMNAAEGHSVDMAVNDFWGHVGSNGSYPVDRIEAAGYGGWSQWAENVAVGYSTPQIVMNAWMNSAPHRANILNCALEEIGVGYVYINPDPGNVTYRHYWTQDFAKPR